VNEIQSQMLEEDARQRGSRRMPDDRLMRAAQGHAEGMAKTGRLSHAAMGDRVTQAGFSWSAVAENVANGQDSVEDVFATWMSSPGHRANILGGTQSAGFGMALRGTEKWFCAIYATESWSTNPAEPPTVKPRRKWLQFVWSLLGR
jgi:hypothetical protein